MALRKLAPEASSLTGTQLGPASMGQKNQASGKEVSIPGWTLLIQELPRDQSSSPSKREIKQTSKKSSPAQTTWTLTSPLGHNQHVSG